MTREARDRAPVTIKEESCLKIKHRWRNWLALMGLSFTDFHQGWIIVSLCCGKKTVLDVFPSSNTKVFIRSRGQ